MVFSIASKKSIEVAMGSFIEFRCGTDLLLNFAMPIFLSLEVIQIK